MIKRKWIYLYSAYRDRHSGRSGTDHTVLPANYTVPFLYLVSIHQMAHPQTEVADI